jgi:serine protease Do
MQRVRMAGAVVVLGGVMLSGGDASAQAAPRSGAATDTTTAAALSSAFRAATTRTLPSVVFIAVEQTTLPPRVDQPDRIPDRFREYFRLPPQEQPREGTGSGFVIDRDGYILTNTHVVADATRMTVRMMDGREYTARLVGSDISSDIAVIKIDARRGEQFPVATLGDSEELRVGDWVLALGNPLGLDFTVTAGIVSAKGRQISDGLEDFIQTDAAINPGNSGGPLIDLFGRVVGINSAIFGTNRFVGYGFAVPINLARRVVGDLREFGYLRRPLLGVEIRAVRAVDAEIYGLSEIRGVFVAAVDPTGPAHQAGVRAGDVILTLGDQDVRDDTHLVTALAESRPGEPVQLGVLREGKRRNIAVTLGEFPRPPARPEPRPAEPREDAEQVLGFTVRELTQADVGRLGYRGDAGVVVEKVIPFSGAYYTQFVREGAILIALNGKRVRSPAEIREIARAIKPGSAISVLIFDVENGERVLNFRARY